MVAVNIFVNDKRLIKKVSNFLTGGGRVGGGGGGRYSSFFSTSAK